jgi:hypothetical protein
MKYSILVILVVGSICTVQSASFQNLDFEGANIQNLIFNNPGPPPSQLGFATDLLPGWSGIFGSVIGLNTFAAGPGYWTIAGVQPANPFNPVAAYGYPVQGQYALFMSSPFVINPADYFPSTVGQVGTIPADARYIDFQTFGGPMELSVNGAVVPLVYHYTVLIPGFPDLSYGYAEGDISAYAGQEVTLGFATVVPNQYINGIDNITFVGVPEPSTLGILFVGIIAFFLWRWMPQCRRG